MQKVSIYDPKVIEKAVAVLKAGGVVMHPTETCYGLAVDVTNKAALDKLHRIKKMPAEKPVSILVDGYGMAEEYGIFSEKAVDLTRDYWPGPLSIVVPRKKKLPVFLNPDEDFVSIRCSSLDFCKEMVWDLGRPVTTTSANVTNEEPRYEPDSQGLDVDLLIDGGKISKNKPSTIIKVEGDNLEVIRRGDINL